MKRGVAAATLYAIAGLIGVPWFADHQSGYVGASFGYILGFILCAWSAGSFLSVTRIAGSRSQQGRCLSERSRSMRWA